MKKIFIACVACVGIVVSCGEGRNMGLEIVSTEAVGGVEQSVEAVLDGLLLSDEKHLPSREDISIEKSLTYDLHTLTDTFSYKDGVREFQFDKMRDRIFTLDSIQMEPAQWAILQNRKNWNGRSPEVKEYTIDEYRQVVDRWGVQRTQSAPLYIVGEYGLQAPERYGRDGSPVKIMGYNADSTAYRVESFNAPGLWEVPLKYVKPIDTERFDKVVMVDLTNQVIATLERAEGDRWLVRSMNPCTTGEHAPPHAYPTPYGMFVVQDRTPKMFYTNGGPSIVGFAPWASRFSNGAFLHGVPVNDPDGKIVEFSSTLGTIPRSHACVRNASSHAKFIYDWAPLNETIVFVYN
jgi:hypothetical protein